MNSVRIWEKSYALRRRLLRGFFLRRGSASEDAEDLAQEVYLRLLRSTGEDADAVENPEAYLFTVAANLAREHARARSSLPPLEDVDLLAEVLKSEEDIEGEFERAQRWNDIPLAPSWETVSGFVTIEIGFLSPFLLPAIVLATIRPAGAPFAEPPEPASD